MLLVGLLNIKTNRHMTNEYPTRILTSAEREKLVSMGINAYEDAKAYLSAAWEDGSIDEKTYRTVLESFEKIKTRRFKDHGIEI